MPLPFYQTGEFYATTCALVWSVAVIFFRKSGDHFSPLALNVFKNLIALVALCSTLLVLGLPFLPTTASTQDWLVLFLSGVLGIGLADTLFFASLNRLGAGRSAIIDCTYTPFVVLASTLFLHEPRKWTLYVAVLAMVLAILIGEWNPSASRDRELPKREVRLGILMGIGSMALMALGISLAKPVLDRAEPWWASLVRLLGGLFVLVFPLFKRVHRQDVLLSLRPHRAWRYAIPGALLGSYIAMILWILGMKYTQTTTAGVLNQLSTIFIMILAVVFLKEPFGIRKFIALLLGFTAGIIVML